MKLKAEYNHLEILVYTVFINIGLQSIILYPRSKISFPIRQIPSFRLNDGQTKNAYLVLKCLVCGDILKTSKDAEALIKAKHGTTLCYM